MSDITELILDITELILDDHEKLRRGFARLDDAATDEELAAIWWPLADFLDVHAAAEEHVFYPKLLEVADPDGAETKDAIGDHNDIRDGVRKSREAEVGSYDWWDGVNAAREANSKHMAEEEREGLQSFRKNADDRVRAEMGVDFVAYKQTHSTPQKADTDDKDPDEYVEDERND